MELRFALIILVFQNIRKKNFWQRNVGAENLKLV